MKAEDKRRRMRKKKTRGGGAECCQRGRELKIKVAWHRLEITELMKLFSQ